MARGNNAAEPVTGSLRIPDVPGARRRVPDFSGHADGLDDLLGKVVYRRAGPERQVYRFGAGHPAEHGVGEHAHHGADERKITSLLAVPV